MDPITSQWGLLGAAGVCAAADSALQIHFRLGF